ncbi:MAG TPA: RibD family protein, partial [Rhodospirillales bacterium]|nr:RibD family protein [Rhodospirillales bacterium]
ADPELTCRLPGMADRSPVRLVADARLRLPVSARLVEGARTVPTWVLTAAGADPAKRVALQAAGVAVIDVAAGTDGGLEPRAMAGALASRGLTRVMIEGGGTLAAAFLRADLIDRLCWFTAPRIIGADGLPAVGPLGISRISAVRGFDAESVGRILNDVQQVYRRAR